MDEPEEKEQCFLVAVEERRSPEGISQTHNVLQTSSGQAPDMYSLPLNMPPGGNSWSFESDSAIS